jgi:hypothetical protein
MIRLPDMTGVDGFRIIKPIRPGIPGRHALRTVGLIRISRTAPKCGNRRAPDEPNRLGGKYANPGKCADHAPILSFAAMASSSKIPPRQEIVLPGKIDKIRLSH